MKCPNPKTELSVFKGREAKLNRAIFQALAIREPQTIYDIHKYVKTAHGLKNTKYASVNKRVKILEVRGYIERIGSKITKAGFQANVYNIKGKAYLAILLGSINVDDFVEHLDENTALDMLAAVLKGGIKDGQQF